MATVRIHLAQMSPLLSRMITDLLAAESDMEVVGWAAETENSLLAARAQGANVIITQESESRPSDCLEAVMQAAPLTILNIEPSDSSSTSVSLVRRSFTFAGDGSKSLANIVRQATAGN